MGGSKMQLVIRFVMAVAVVQGSCMMASADELWTYYFVANSSRPYHEPCVDGDCFYSGVRADLAGTFSILLNWQNNTGQLYAIESQMVNVAGVRSTQSGEEFFPLVP